MSLTVNYNVQININNTANLAGVECGLQARNSYTVQLERVINL